MARVLEGVRVVDLSASTGAAWCSRLLADYGADVVVVEPLGGHPLRAIGPFTDAGDSIPAAYLLANKRSVTLDLDDANARATAAALCRRADIVVSSHAPSRLAAWGLDYATLATPTLVMVHVTPHGMTGDLAEVPGNDLTDAARSGWASINGSQEREPLKPSGWQPSMCAGTVAYAGAVAALRWRDGHPGEGQEVDVSEVEVMAAAFAPALLRSVYAGKAQGRRDPTDHLAGPVPVQDGYFALTISRAHFWRDAMNLLGLPDLAEDPRWGASFYRQAHKDEYVGRVTEAMSQWTKMDLFDELAVRRVVAGPVLTMEELRGVEHLRERDFWRKPADQPDGPEYPGPALRMNGTPASLDRRPPRPGEHTAEVLDTVGGAS
ncbi:MAG: CoA transferase [Chloroflexi bacterium]|nr:CoA transferase [Chloroflexota bacterium]MDA1240648.1 CoA transferase [Chloroflexota bacterium]